MFYRQIAIALGQSLRGVIFSFRHEVGKYPLTTPSERGHFEKGIANSEVHYEWCQPISWELYRLLPRTLCPISLNLFPLALYHILGIPVCHALSSDNVMPPEKQCYAWGLLSSGIWRHGYFGREKQNCERNYWLRFQGRASSKRTTQLRI